jgi:hypothetical protein
MDIHVEGAEQLIAKLTTVQQFNKVKAAISQESVMLIGKLKHYPRKTYTPNPLIKSNPKVRRAFFAKMKAGEISVPYKRSGDLRKQWNAISSLGGWTATISNPLSYAPLVQGENQTYGHGASGWLTVSAAEKKYAPKIKQRIMKAIEEELRNV